VRPAATDDRLRPYLVYLLKVFSAAFMNDARVLESVQPEYAADVAAAMQEIRQAIQDNTGVLLAACHPQESNALSYMYGLYERAEKMGVEWDDVFDADGAEAEAAKDGNFAVDGNG